MGFGWQEIDKTLDLGNIRVAGLHHECKPSVLFDPPNFRPRTMTHVCMYVCMYVYVGWIIENYFSASCFETLGPSWSNATPLYTHTHATLLHVHAAH